MHVLLLQVYVMYVCLVCVAASKRKPPTLVPPMMVPPTVVPPTVVTTAHGTGPKRSRTTGTQHNIMPISLGHGFRPVGMSPSQRDLFTDTQDTDLALTQPDPTTQGSRPSTPMPAMQALPTPTGSGTVDTMAVIQDSFKAIQDGIAAISSYIMGQQARNQLTPVQPAPAAMTQVQPATHTAVGTNSMINVPSFQQGMSPMAITTLAANGTACALAPSNVASFQPNPGINASCQANTGNNASGQANDVLFQVSVGSQMAPNTLAPNAPVFVNAGHNVSMTGFQPCGYQGGFSMANSHGA